MLRLILTSGLFISLGSVVSGGATIIQGIALSNMFVSAEYGSVILLQSTLGTLGIIACFGTATAAIKYTAEFNDGELARLRGLMLACLRLIIWSSAIVIVLCFYYAEYLVTKILNSPNLNTAIQIGCPSIMLLAIDALFKGIILGAKRYLLLAKSTTIGSLISASSVISITYIFKSLNAVAIGVLIGSFLQVLVTILVSQETLSNIWNAKGSAELNGATSTVIKFSFPALVSGFLVAPAHWYVQTQLAKTQGGLTEVAIFGIAMQIFNLVIFLPTNMGKAILPMLKIKSKNENNHNFIILRYSVIFNGVSAFIVCLIAYAFMPNILGLYGNEYGNQKAVLTSFLIAAIVLSLQVPVGHILITNGDMWLGVKMNAIWAIIFITLSILLIKHWGAAGIGYSLVVAYVAHTYWIYDYVRRQK